MLEEYMKGGEQISFLYPRCQLPFVFLPHHGISEGQSSKKVHDMLCVFFETYKCKIS
jgi:hypothetical protein